MKNILSIILISGFLFSCSNKNKRYHIDKTTSPNDTLTFLRTDMSLINGVIYSKYGEIGSFVNGKKDGLCSKYDKNGKLIKHGNYILGKEEGFIKKYDVNGQLIEKEFYRNGKKDSTHYSYYGNGQLRQMLFFVNDKIEGLSKSYHENGKVHKEINYVNGKKEGESKQYYDNEQLKLEENYLEDKLDGLSKQYYENGQLKSEKKFKNDKLDGIYKWYNSYGDLYKSVYKNGKREINRIKLRKLYNIVTSDDAYTKSFEDFISDYGSSERGKKIYPDMHNYGYYFESYIEFINTFW